MSVNKLLLSYDLNILYYNTSEQYSIINTLTYSRRFSS